MSVDGEVVGAFDGPGLVVLVGVTHDDTADVAASLARKVFGLRLFDGADGPEQSASDLGLPVLVISQFTLYGETRKGRRPTWDAAAPGPTAEPLVGAFAQALRDAGARVETGRFGADMKVSFTNDGPITLILDTER